MHPIVDVCLERMEKASDLPALQGVLDQTLKDLGFDRR